MKNEGDDVTTDHRLVTFTSFLNSIRKTRESEVTDLHIRNQQVLSTTRTTTFACNGTNLFAQGFEVVQHNDWTFIEPEVLDRVFDLSILDEESSIASQTGEQQRLRINGTDIPEACYEHTALRVFDHIFERSITTFHDGITGKWDRG